MPDHEVLTLQIELIGSDPLIWRTVDVPADTMLYAAGNIVQIAMGWENCHLQAFHSKNPYERRQGEPEVLSWYEEYSLADGLPGEPQETTTLGQAFAVTGAELYFEYDFGDSWMHRITLAGSRTVTDDPLLPRVLDGAMRAPIEDSGGIGGWYEKLEALTSANPTEEQQDIVEWMHWRVGPEGTVDPAAFDLESCNRKLAARGVGLEWNTVLGRWLLDQQPLCREFTLEHVEKHGLQLAAQPEPLPEWFLQDLVRPYQVLIGLCEGEGIKLTAAGWMPPATVGELVEALGWEGIDHESSKKKLESNMPSVMMLRDSATDLRLLRKYKGRLLATKLGQKLGRDLAELAGHLLARFNVHPSPHLDQDSDMANWVARAAGHVRFSKEHNQFKADFMNVLGYSSGHRRMPLTKEDHVYFTRASLLWEELACRGLVGDINRPGDNPRDLRSKELARLVLGSVVDR